MPEVHVPNVKPIIFNTFQTTKDGKSIVFEVVGKGGAKGHIMVEWEHLSIMLQMTIDAAAVAEDRRRADGNPDYFTGEKPLVAQLVKSYQVSEFPVDQMRILTLLSEGGFRMDFAIPTNAQDQLGRALHRAMSEDLVADLREPCKQPN